MLTDEQKREILAKCREDIDCFEEKRKIAIDEADKYRCPVNSDLLDEMWDAYNEWCQDNGVEADEDLDVENELFWFDDGTPAPEPKRDQDSFDEGQDSVKKKVLDVINMMEAYTKKDDLVNLDKKTLVELIVRVNTELHNISL
jgi:hypothetical protein